MAMFLVLKSDVLCLTTLVPMGYERSLLLWYQNFGKERLKGYE